MQTFYARKKLKFSRRNQTRSGCHVRERKTQRRIANGKYAIQEAMAEELDSSWRAAITNIADSQKRRIWFWLPDFSNSKCYWLPHGISWTPKMHVCVSALADAFGIRCAHARCARIIIRFLFFSLLNRKSLQFFLLLFRIYKHTCHRCISTMRHRARAVDFIIAVRAQFHFSRFFLLSFLTMKEMYLHNWAGYGI